MAERYAIYLTGEIDDDVIDWEVEAEPTAEEKERFADWPPSRDRFTFHRLKRAWNDHPAGALVAWDGCSVILMAY